jgi:hypothetical protein
VDSKSVARSTSVLERSSLTFHIPLTQWQLRFIYEPPAPEDEVLRLLDEGSFLLQDDFGLLAEQKKWQEQLLDLEGKRNDRYQHPSAETGWTVYGGRTNQEFDPLQYEYHKEM